MVSLILSHNCQALRRLPLATRKLTGYTHIMNEKLLIVSPHKSFGDLLKHNLEMNEFIPELVDSGDAALGAIGINLAILDADLNDPTIESLFSRLQGQGPGMGFIIIHSLDQSVELPVNPETPFRTLSRPFDFPALLDAIHEILNPDAIPKNMSKAIIDNEQDIYSLKEMSPSLTSWFYDPDSVRQRLKTSIFSPLIKEAVLISSDKILGLTWDAAEPTIFQLQEILNHHLDKIGEYSMVKYFRIDKGEHILYTTPLSIGAGIVGIFCDPAIKYSLASAIVKEYAVRILREQSNTNISDESVYDHQNQTSTLPVPQGIHIPKTNDSTWDINQSQMVMSGVIINQAEQSTLDHSPAPGLMSREDEFLPQLDEPTQRDIQSAEGIPDQWIPEEMRTSSTGKAAQEPEIVYPWEENEEVGKSPGLKTELEPDAAGKDAYRTERSPDDNSLEVIVTNARTSPNIEETQPIDLKYQSESYLQQITPSNSEYSPTEMVEYSFLMISNHPEFRMIGDIEEIIGEEIQEICQANNWNLLILNIHSDYLQISVKVPTAMPPGIIIRLLREKTTLRIVENFEDIDSDIVTEDFWAKGYLVTNGIETEI